MSRSYRHTPIFGFTMAPSEKWQKRRARHVWRQAVKVALGNGAEILPHLREVSNVWSMPKDGKRWYSARRWPKVLRK